MISAAHCRVRKDSVRMVEALVTASPEFFKDKTNREIRAYFAHTLKFLEGRQRPDTFLSAVIHMDEKTPHLHLCFVHLTLVGALREGDVAGRTPGVPPHRLSRSAAFQCHLSVDDLRRRHQGSAGDHRTRQCGYAGEHLHPYPAVLPCGAGQEV